MNPASFFFSTVLPALVMALIWLLGSKENAGRKMMPLILSIAFVGGFWQLAGPPQPQWPMVINSFLVYFGLGVGLLEATLQSGHKRWHGVLGGLLVLFLVFCLRARLLDSGIWEGGALSHSLILGCVAFILFAPSIFAINKMASLGVRIALILTGVAMSVVLLLSGSALMAQSVGICVALQVAIVGTHLVFQRKNDLAASGLITVYALYMLFILLGYFFVEVPRWPWLGLCASMVLAPLASYRRRDKFILNVGKAVGVSLPALAAAAYVVMQSLPAAAPDGY